MWPRDWCILDAGVGALSAAVVIILHLSVEVPAGILALGFASVEMEKFTAGPVPGAADVVLQLTN